MLTMEDKQRSPAELEIKQFHITGKESIRPLSYIMIKMENRQNSNSMTEMSMNMRKELISNEEKKLGQSFIARAFLWTVHTVVICCQLIINTNKL